MKLRHARSRSRSNSNSKGSYDAADASADLGGLDPLTVTEMLGLQVLHVLPQEQFRFGAVERRAPGIVGQKKQLARRSRETQLPRRLMADRRLD